MLIVLDRMTTRGPTSRRGTRPLAFHLLVVAFLCLPVVAQVQSGLAILGSFWWLIPSWDSPATHAFEDAASLVPPYTDPTRYASDSIIAAATHSIGGRRSLEPCPCTKQLALSSRITRSPPAA